MTEQTSGCDCSSHAPNDEVGPFEYSTMSGAETLIDTLSAFSGLVDLAPQEEPLVAVGDQLVAAGNALLVMGQGLADVETDGERGRERLVEDLEDTVYEVGDLLTAAGQEALQCQGGDAAPMLLQGAETLAAAAATLDDGSFEAGASLVFPVYAAALAAPVQGLMELGSALKSKGKKAPEQMAGAVNLLAGRTSHAAACLDAVIGSSGLYVNDATIVHLDPACKGCPYVGCTVYCSDRYRAQISCTSSGLFTVCRWHVTRTIKTVCCCYASAWDRFWAINCCKKQISTRTRRLVKRTTHVGSPPNAPFTVVTLC